MNVQECEAKTELKLKSLTADNPIAALAQFLTARPVGSKNRDLIRRDLELLQAIVGKMQEKDHDNLVRTLKEDDCELLVDYLHRYMQWAGEAESQTSSTAMGLVLKLYERVVKEYGPSLIIKANSRSDTLVARINNY